MSNNANIINFASPPAIGGTTPAAGSFTTFSATGLQTLGGTKVTTASAMGALAIDVTKALNTKSISVDSTFTFSGTPGASNQWFGMLVTNSDSASHVLTIPSSFSISRAGAITTVTIPASGKLLLTWQYDGSAYNLYGDPPATTGTGSFVLATSPTLVTPVLGTPASGNLSNCTGGPTLTSATLITPALGTPASGNLSACTADGTNAVGFLGAPQQSKSADYTLVLGDAGKSIFHPVGDNNARAFTIPANASVAFPIGTIVEFINMAAASCTIPITSDTMTLLPAGTTGTRTLAQYGRASAEKITSTSWVVSGNSALT